MNDHHGASSITQADFIKHQVLYENCPAPWKVVMNKVKDADIADLLRTCRERAGLSQQELARRLYIDQAIVSKVENGKLTPSYTLVKQWAKLTKSSDLIAMHMAGHADVTRKYHQMESIVKQAKSIFEAVNFMRLRKERRKRNAARTST